jgi:Rod binding domain-containing protein
MVPGVANVVTSPGTGDPQPRNIAQAAEQFEALLLAQLLKGAHEDGSDGWLGTGDDQAGSSMIELAQEHLAQSMASQGGLGLAGLISSGIRRADAAATRAVGTASGPPGASGGGAGPAVADRAGLKPHAD